MSVSISNYFSVGGPSPANFNRNTQQAADDVDFIHGKHQLVFGGEWIHHQLNSINASGSDGNFAFNGTYSGDALADYMLGALSSYGQSMPTDMNFRQNYIGMYVQDDYRVNPASTFTLAFAGSLSFPKLTNSDEEAIFPCRDSTRISEAANTPPHRQGFCSSATREFPKATPITRSTSSNRALASPGT